LVADNRYNNNFIAYFYIVVYAIELLILIGINIKSYIEYRKSSLNLYKLDFIVLLLINYLFITIGKGINKNSFLIDVEGTRLRVTNNTINI
jgi:hypothetical protein